MRPTGYKFKFQWFVSFEETTKIVSTFAQRVGGAIVKYVFWGMAQKQRQGLEFPSEKTASFGNQGLFLHYCVEFSLFLRAPVACLRRFPLPLSSLSHTHTQLVALPATENASLQILSTVSHLPPFILQNPYMLLIFDKVPHPLPLPRKPTSERPKVVQTCEHFVF